MGSKFSDESLIDYLSGEMPPARERELLNQMEVSPELCERIEKLSSVRGLEGVPADLGKLAELPPLDRKLASRLYRFGPARAASDGQHTGDAVTLLEPPDAEPATNLPGDNPFSPVENWLGEYELFEEIGSGAAGVVYRARHRRLNRQAAVKVLSTRVAAAPSAIQRFHREIEAIGKLDHPNIIQAQYAGESRGRHYLAMEFVRCRDLVDIIGTVGMLNTGDACAIAVQCARGLQHAHQSSIVHRDVKPSNLLLTDEGLVKITDFGLAKLRDRPGSGRRFETIDKHIMGTLEFMAPEQLADSRNVDIRADIYGLGCTLFYLLTEKTPHNEAYAQGGLVSMLNARESRAPARAVEYRSDLPAELLRVLDKMLAPDPDDRYAAPAEVAEALADFAARGDLRKLWNAATAQESSPADAASLDPMSQSTQANVATIAEVAAGPADEVRQHRPAPLLRKRLVLFAVVALGTIVAVAGLWKFLNSRDSAGDPAARSPAAEKPSSTDSGERKAAAAQSLRAAGGLKPGSVPASDAAAEKERRRIAEWLLSIDARIHVVVGDEEFPIRGVAGLPEKPFKLVHLTCYHLDAITNETMPRIFKLVHLRTLTLRQVPIDGNGLAGIEALKSLYKLEIWHAPIAAAGMEHIERLRHLTVLKLIGVGLKDNDLKRILPLQSLNTISFAENNLTDACATYLVSLPLLQHAGLAKTQIGEAGIRKLDQCKKLSTVHLGSGTAVTPQGLKRLRNAGLRFRIQ